MSKLNQRRLAHVGGLGDEPFLGINPVGAVVAASLGPAKFEIAFAAQVRMRLLVIGGHMRFRRDERGLDCAFRVAAAGENEGADTVVEFGVLGH